MGPTTTIPAAIDGLVTALAAALPDVQVLDGPSVGEQLQRRHVVVGGDPEEPAVTGARTEKAQSPSQWSEDFEIPVVVAAYGAASGPQKTPRDEAAALLDAAHAAILADRTLGGAVLEASIGAVEELDQRPASRANSAGAEAVTMRRAAFKFAVVCHGWVT